MSGAKPFDTGELSTDRMGSDAISNFLLKLKQFYIFFRIHYHRVQKVSLPCEIAAQFIPGFLEDFVRLR